MPPCLKLDWKIVCAGLLLFLCSFWIILLWPHCSPYPPPQMIIHPGDVSSKFFVRRPMGKWGGRGAELKERSAFLPPVSFYSIVAHDAVWFIVNFHCHSMTLASTISDSWIRFIFLLVQTPFCGEVGFGIWLKHNGKLFFEVVFGSNTTVFEWNLA